MSNKGNHDPYEELANAIALQAVKDYRSANKKLARGRRNYEAERMRENSLRFFRSAWFSMLTDINPEFLIERLDKEVRDDG